MSDQLRWFKLWCSAPLDPDLAALPRGLRWAWAAVGCYTQTHGTRGRLVLTDSNMGLTPIASYMGTAPELVAEELKKLPHMTVNYDNGEIIVTWDNWRKFQRDSTVSERVKRLRSKRRGEISSVVSSSGDSRGARQPTTASSLPPCGCGSPNCDRKFWRHRPHLGKPGEVWEQCGCWDCDKARRESSEVNG